MRTTTIGWSLSLLLLAGAGAGEATTVDPGQVAALENPRIDAGEFLRLTVEATTLRERRRLSEADFLRLAGEPGTVILDARSRDKYAELHVRGAVSLPFPDFTVENLARAIPDPTAAVLIYCNNNFAGAEGEFPTKVAPAALNLSTFVALFSYGYENVYELGPLLEVKATRLALAGTTADSYRR